ncbi:MAG: Tad domain-containing protein [Bdellovibrionota bacterium]
MGTMKHKRRLLDETGQMSIFVALIFQVLFIFFAMVVNIGLIVHDKINLQNAVDFGAYYAAERQSEILNEIAHINYQIRQDYKLLAWRYRVLGTLGRQMSNLDTDIAGMPPARTPPTVQLQDVAYPMRNNEVPAVCVMNTAWDTTVQGAQRENYCFRPYNTTTQLTPITPIIAPWVPGIFGQRASEVFSRSTQLQNCNESGPANWRFTMQIIYGYKLAIATRKQMIFKLRRNLADPNFRDQEEKPVRDGVLNTIRKNLTSTNKEGFDDGYFDVYNGLSHPDCVGPNQNGDRTIVDIPTKPLLVFVNVVGGNACIATLQTHDNYNSLDPNMMNLWDPDRSMRTLAAEPDIQGEQYPEHSSLGFEKNPWCMSYVGVHARSRPRKPFAPFGQPVLLEARSFAQPFGGRIGPWYRNSWNKTSPQSDGPNRVDPLTSPRFVGGTLDGNDLDRLPNFSRYPGDQLGLKSMVALGAQRHILAQFYTNNNALKLRTSNYIHFDQLPSTGDPLAFNLNDPPTQVNSEIALTRQAEIGAVTPDVFDATYFSIDPNFFQNYFQKANASGRYSGMSPVLGRPARTVSDVGSRVGHPVLGPQTVESQIGSSFNGGGSTPSGLDPSLTNGDLRYAIKDWRHLLTGWTLPKAQVFTFPDATFGKCDKVAPPEVMIPGKCAQSGGRVGYSVRLLSRDYLLSDKWNVGGDGVGPSSILNPPDPAF